SSRRRHTRWPRDWSSDVCSSDLWIADLGDFLTQPLRWARGQERSDSFVIDDPWPALWECAILIKTLGQKLMRYRTPQLRRRRSRSEERRVGKECRARRAEE